MVPLDPVHFPIIEGYADEYTLEYKVIVQKIYNKHLDLKNDPHFNFDLKLLHLISSMDVTNLVNPLTVRSRAVKRIHQPVKLISTNNLLIYIVLIL